MYDSLINVDWSTFTMFDYVKIETLSFKSTHLKIVRSRSWSDHLIKRPLCIGMRGQGSSAIKLIHLMLVFDKLTWKSRWIRFDWLRLDDVCHLTLQMIAFHSNCDLCFYLGRSMTIWLTPHAMILLISVGHLVYTLPRILLLLPLNTFSLIHFAPLLLSLSPSLSPALDRSDFSPIWDSPRFSPPGSEGEEIWFDLVEFRDSLSLWNFVH